MIITFLQRLLWMVALVAAQVMVFNYIHLFGYFAYGLSSFLIINAMKECRHNRYVAQTHLHHGDACHVDKVQHVGLARKQIATVVFLQTIAVRLVNQGQMFRRVDGGVNVVQHRLVGLLDGQYFQ